MMHEIECLYCKKKVQKEITKKKYRNTPVFCSRECQLRGQNFEWNRADEEEKKAKLLQNFYRNLIVKNGCWSYKTKRACGTYIQVEVGKRKYELLHRLSWVLHYGEIPDGMVVRHLCNSPRCVRPSHLALGTYQDNSDDMVKSNRQAKGKKHGMSKLDEKNVKKIKKMLLNGIYQHKEIGEMFGVSKACITNINLERTWKHVSIEE